MCTMVLGLIGGVVQGIGAMQSANAAADSHEANAASLAERATQQRMQGAYEGARITEKAARVGGQQRAAAAEGGLAMTGSAAEVAVDTGQEFDLEVGAVLWNSKAAANQSLDQADIEKMNASNARASAPLAFLSPVLGAATRFSSSFA
jgi:hypothetical protein